jgi:hypothetical protein
MQSKEASGPTQDVGDARHVALNVIGGNSPTICTQSSEFPQNIPDERAGAFQKSPLETSHPATQTFPRKENKEAEMDAGCGGGGFLEAGIQFIVTVGRGLGEVAEREIRQKGTLSAHHTRPPTPHPTHKSSKNLQESSISSHVLLCS